MSQRNQHSTLETQDKPKDENPKLVHRRSVPPKRALRRRILGQGHLGGARANSSRKKGA